MATASPLGVPRVAIEAAAGQSALVEPAPVRPPAAGALAALDRHWPEYAIEAAGVGAFMVSTCAFGTFLEHPGSLVRQVIPDPSGRRIVMGLLMGLTATAIIYSRWGQRSGAHLNPAVTLVFWRLGKIESWAAVFYVLAQFVGGVLGVGLASLFLGRRLAVPAVHYVVTVPGPIGAGVAFGAEVVITFGLMLAVLTVSHTARWASWTGLCAGALVAAYIAVEAPLSGMSMNPARTLGSAVYAGTWTALWVYFTAPFLGMLAAADFYRIRRGIRAVRCAKLQHAGRERCIFRCQYANPGVLTRAP